MTFLQLRSLPVGRHSDGGGLYLDAQPGGARYWRMKQRFAKAERLLAVVVHFPRLGPSR